jgi:uncharacterized protein (TIGR03000 family)
MTRFKLAVLTTLALVVVPWAAGYALAGHGGGGGGGGGGHGGGYGGYGGGYGGHGGYGEGYGGYGYGGSGYGRGFGEGFGGYGRGYGGYGYGGYGYGGYGYGSGLGFWPGLYPGGYYGYTGYGHGYGGAYPDVLVAPVYVTGSAPAVPAVPGAALPPQDPAAPAPPPPPAQGADNRAYIHVLVPADALLWFEGQATTQTGPVRDFASPELPSDKIYDYEIKARWTQNGQPLERTLLVKVQRNKTAVADFHALPPPGGVAAPGKGEPAGSRSDPGQPPVTAAKR